MALLLGAPASSVLGLGVEYYGCRCCCARWSRVCRSRGAQFDLSVRPSVRNSCPAAAGLAVASIYGQTGRPARHWHGHGQARHYAARHVSRAVPDGATVPTQWPRHGTIMA